MNKNFAWICLSFFIASFNTTSHAQPGGSAPSNPTRPAPVQKLPSQPFDNMFELPPPLLLELELSTKQTELLDDAHLARRQLWSAMRNARSEEYVALTKALEKEPFDPKEVIALRKKIRATSDKRMDDVQSVWLKFWESLNPSQRKILVAYMKQQHVNGALLSKQRAAQEKAAAPALLRK